MGVFNYLEELHEMFHMYHKMITKITKGEYMVRDV